MTNDDDNEEARVRKARTAASALSFVIWISFVMRQSCLVILFHSFLIRHLAFVIFSKISATEQV
jgi:hypothetical protein